MEKSKKKYIVLLHGFLGVPEDWNFLTQAKTTSDLQFLVPDYMNSQELGPHLGLLDWGKAFNNHIGKILKESPFGLVQTELILVGYSLGGRLALHAFAEDPGLWGHLFCLSTNPGFRQDDPHLLTQRSLRINSDLIWANNFLSGDFATSMTKWNQQSVFSGSANEPVRCQKSYNLKSLEQALTNWSLAHQRDFRTLISQQHKKITWIVGQQDEKYVSLALELRETIQGLNCLTLENAGHRLLWDNPAGLEDILLENH